MVSSIAFRNVNNQGCDTEEFRYARRIMWARKALQLSLTPQDCCYDLNKATFDTTKIQ